MTHEEFMKQTFTDCQEVDNLIAELEDKCPDKRTKDYILWKEKMNFLFETYNRLAKFTCFKPIK